MKKRCLVTTTVATTAAMGLLAGCHSMAVAKGQTIPLNDHASLVMGVEGAQSSGITGGAARPEEGEPFHRILRDSDGKVVFAYDLDVSSSPTGETYSFTLKPAGAGPTFANSRKVTAALYGGVRVELMEQPGTGRQIVDVFRVVPQANGEQSFTSHLMALHNRFFHWVHGE
jgi:hypothetical protein